MHRTVAEKAKAGEVLERIVRLIFVAMVHVYGDLAVRCAAGFAFATGMLPTVNGGLAVAGHEKSMFLVACRSSSSGGAGQSIRVLARLVFALAFHHLASVVFAITIVTEHADAAALDANSTVAPLRSRLLHALAIFDQTLHAHRLAGRRSIFAANALETQLTHYRLDGVLVTPKTSRDGHRALQFIVEAKRFVAVNFHQSFSGFGGVSYHRLATCTNRS